jgi:hypothetical protein
MRLCVQIRFDLPGGAQSRLTVFQFLSFPPFTFGFFLKWLSWFSTIQSESFKIVVTLTWPISIVPWTERVPAHHSCFLGCGTGLIILVLENGHFSHTEMIRRVWKSPNSFNKTHWFDAALVVKIVCTSF